MKLLDYADVAAIPTLRIAAVAQPRRRTHDQGKRIVLLLLLLLACTPLVQVLFWDALAQLRLALAIQCFVLLLMAPLAVVEWVGGVA